MMNFPGTPHGPSFAPVLQGGMPVGAVIAFAGPLGEPVGQGPGNTGMLQACGWMPCDGRALTCPQYPELFRVLGYAYGGADDLFHIPDYRGDPLRGPGQAAPGPQGVTYIIRFVGGLQPLPPLAAAAMRGKDPMPQDAPVAASSGAGSVQAEMAANLPDEAVTDDRVLLLDWHATPDYRFDFRLIYGQDGRFKSLECAVHSRQMAPVLNGVYPLPLSLKHLDAAGRNVEIRMDLVAGHGPWDHGVWCWIDVPGYRFEGVAFEFSKDYSGLAPITIW